MTTQTKILIGIAALGAGFIAYKMYKNRNKSNENLQEETKSNFTARRNIFKRPQLKQEHDIYMCYNKDTDHGYVGFSPCDAGYEDITPKS